MEGDSDVKIMNRWFRRIAVVTALCFTGGVVLGWKLHAGWVRRDMKRLAELETVVGAQVPQ
ncbi:MAG: hypothetical protein MHM6MM_004838 [Cercozoa sp. M6MM]